MPRRRCQLPESELDESFEPLLDGDAAGADESGEPELLLVESEASDGFADAPVARDFDLLSVL